jgi:hypothetical protein
MATTGAEGVDGAAVTVTVIVLDVVEIPVVSLATA